MSRTDKSNGAERGGSVATESLEAFVAQLHDEGVEAGRAEAERLVREAREQATAIVREARARADALLAEAEEGARRAEARGRDELELAARDAVLELQAALAETLTRVWSRGVAAELRDPEVLTALLREVVRAYAAGDAVGRPTEVRVPGRLARDVEAWWSRELADALESTASVTADPVLDAGFEYRIGGGAVEVTVESVVEKLMQSVQPRLREILTRGSETPTGEVREAARLVGVGDRGS